MGAVGAIAGGLVSKVAGGAISGAVEGIAGQGKEKGGGPEDLLKMVAQLLNGAKGGEG